MSIVLELYVELHIKISSAETLGKKYYDFIRLQNTMTSLLIRLVKFWIDLLSQIIDFDREDTLKLVCSVKHKRPIFCMVDFNQVLKC